MLLKKTLRTLLKYKAQFISMAIMIALGVGVFLGFNIEWYALEKNTDRIYRETGFADYRIYDTDKGFSAEDAEKLLAIEGIENVTRFISLKMSVQDSNDVVALTLSENMDVSGFKLMEGEAYDPDSADGMWLSDSYAAANGVKLGDEHTDVQGLLRDRHGQRLHQIQRIPDLPDRRHSADAQLRNLRLCLRGAGHAGKARG